MKIEVHIDRLVLDGVDGADRGAMAAALTERLERLLAEGGLPPGLVPAGTSPAGAVASARATLDGGTVPAAAAELGPRSRGIALGSAVAQNVYAALGATRGSAPGRTPGGRSGS